VNFDERFVSGKIRVPLGSFDGDAIVRKVEEAGLVEVEEVDEPQIVVRGEALHGIVPIRPSRFLLLIIAGTSGLVGTTRSKERSSSPGTRTTKA